MNTMIPSGTSTTVRSRECSFGSLVDQLYNRLRLFDIRMESAAGRYSHHRAEHSCLIFESHRLSLPRVQQHAEVAPPQSSESSPFPARVLQSIVLHLSSATPSQPCRIRFSTILEEKSCPAIQIFEKQEDEGRRIGRRLFGKRWRSKIQEAVQ